MSVVPRPCTRSPSVSPNGSRVHARAPERDGVEVAGEAQRRAPAAAGQAGDEVRAPRVERHARRPRARPPRGGRAAVRRPGLAPGRVDRVERDQLERELDDRRGHQASRSCAGSARSGRPRGRSGPSTPARLTAGLAGAAVVRRRPAAASRSLAAAASTSADSHAASASGPASTHGHAVVHRRGHGVGRGGEQRRRDDVLPTHLHACSRSRRRRTAPRRRPCSGTASRGAFGRSAFSHSYQPSASTRQRPPAVPMRPISEPNQRLAAAVSERTLIGWAPLPTAAAERGTSPQRTASGSRRRGSGAVTDEHRLGRADVEAPERRGVDAALVEVEALGHPAPVDVGEGVAAAHGVTP